MASEMKMVLGENPARWRRAPHVYDCWHGAAKRGMQPFTSYSPKTTPLLDRECVGGWRCVTLTPRVCDGVPVCASAARISRALWRRTAASGDVWGPSYSLVYLTTLGCVVSRSLVKFDFHRSPSRFGCVGTCAACVRSPVPCGRPGGAAVHELFIENHTLYRWGCVWGRGCHESRPRGGDCAPVCASAARMCCAPWL